MKADLCGVLGKCVEAGNDLNYQPRLIVQITRAALNAHRGNLIYADVAVIRTDKLGKDELDFLRRRVQAQRRELRRLNRKLATYLRGFRNGLESVR